MPVRFEKSSEYDRSYKWVESYLDPDFMPSLEQSFPPAGMASIDTANVLEPPLQRRRKPVDVTRTSTTYFEEVPPKADDYILVGDQSKFAPSVKYRVLGKNKENVANGYQAAQPNGATETVSATEHKTESKKNEKSENKKDKGKNGRGNCPVHSEAKQASRSASAPALQNGDGLPKEDRPAGKAIPPPTAERSPPPAPRPKDIAPVPKKKPDNYIQRPTKPTIKSRPPPPPKREAKKKAAPEKAVKVSQPAEEEGPQWRPADPREKRKGKLNEFAQTDLDKGIADSGQEAPADYAMKYRAGIPPPRPRGPKRLSEYQMQYQWKKGVSSSPLLAAEHLVYNSNPHLAPYSNPDVPPKMSEYKAAFKNYEYKPVPIESVAPAKKPKLQRSKSMEVVSATKEEVRQDIPQRPEVHIPQSSEVPIPQSLEVPAETEEEIPISPEKLRAAGTRSGARSEEDKRLLRESLNPTHLLFPHGRTRNIGSEYASNYKNPTRFSYEDGAWRGADPPHIQPIKTPAPVAAEKPEKLRPQPAPGTSWYKEVMELRNKAQEYKQRARGTHFSREHLAQLYAQQADLWDTVSNSSVLSALSLESASAMAAKQRPQSPDSSSRSSAASVATVEKAANRPPKLAWAAKVNGEQNSARSKATSEVSLQGSAPESLGTNTVDTLLAGQESEEGRVPTPKFRKEHDLAGYKWRHHLDRTTPAVGGALLTSPPQRKKTKTRTKSDTALRAKTSDPKVSASWAAPASGLPTRDSHVLVDEEASVDRPLPTKYTQSPPLDKFVGRKVPFGVDHMPTLRETLRELSNSTGGAQDDDAVSISARSVASSCSLASEVLERARNRRDEFWGQNNKKASRS